MENVGFFTNFNASSNGWDQSTDQTANFESALSSLVSSPSSSNPNSDNLVIRELIGRLGSICSNNNGSNEDISISTPPNYHYHSNNNSCYNTPLNSPPKLHLSVPFASDPGFAERAARFSCFGPAEPGQLSRVSSSKSLNANLQDEMMMMMMLRPGEVTTTNNNVQETKSAAAPDNVGRKRKGSRAKEAKKAEEESFITKRSKSGGEAEGDADENDGKMPKGEEDNGEGESRQKQGKSKENESNVKAAEPPKQDYIHVRARRGQATDSHSLAERVRREKISERMKFLQDLVPGCNKVTGKAVMLDEIINYVQSLQRQVEFLSMKLATVNPRPDFSMDCVLSKDQPNVPMVPPHSSYQLDAASTSGFPYGNEPQGQGHSLQSLLACNSLRSQCSVNDPLPLGASTLLGRSLGIHLPHLDGLTDGAVSQLGAFWEEDLQSVVQMGFGHNQEAIFSSHNLQGPMPPSSHMKIEL